MPTDDERVEAEARSRWPDDWFDRAQGDRNQRMRYAFETGAKFARPLLHDRIIQAIRESWSGETWFAWADSEYARGQLELALTLTVPRDYEDGDDSDTQRKALWAEVWEVVDYDAPMP